MAATTKGFIRALDDALNEAAVEGRIRSYSGRFMYGARCVGVRLERGDEADFLFALGGVDERKEFKDFIKSARTDSLGLGIILYFPAAKLADDEDIDED